MADEKQDKQRNKPSREITLVLRCYVVRHGDRFYANCIDLNLSVERPTMQKAIEELNLLIETYLEDVKRLGCPAHLIHRPAPFARRLEYWKLRCLIGIVGLFTHPRDYDVNVDHKQIPCAA